MAINRFFQPVQNTLEEFVPLPMNQLMQAAAMIQQRGDLAQEQQMQTEIGLSSIEALAPAYAQFKDNFVNTYRKQAGELLDKYQGNTSNPEFIREIKRLNTAANADPRLQTLRSGNEYIKNQMKLQQELDAKGIKYINPLKNFTGLDQNGRLTTPTGAIRATNFDEDIAKTFQTAGQNIVEDGNGIESNKSNLDATAKALVSNLDGNPTTREAIEWYQQQGYNPQQARQKTLELINQSYTNNLKVKKNYEKDRLMLSQAQFRAGREDAAFDRQYKMAQLGIAAKKANAADKGKPSDLLRQQVVSNGNKAINTIVGDQKVLTTHTSSRKVAGDMVPRNLKNVQMISTDGKNRKGAMSNVVTQPTQDVLVYLDGAGNIVTGDKNVGGVFNASNRSYRQGKDTKSGLKPVAMREYVDPKGNRYYEPLNYQETILSGFDPSQNIDFKPLLNGLDALSGSSYEKVSRNKSGGKNYDLKGDRKITMNRDLKDKADQLLKNAGLEGLDALPEYKRTQQLIKRFNEGKKISKSDYDFIQNFNNDLTQNVYEFINESTIYPYLGGKPAQNQVAKEFMTPFSNYGRDLTTKEIQKLEEEE